MSAYVLYRFFDAKDGLLYLGIIGKGVGRWHQHARLKHGGRIAHCTVEHFTGRS